MPSTTFELTDRKLLNILQSGFPLIDEPFRAIGEQLGISESEVMARVADLTKKNVIRQIGAIFDTRRLGYRTSLVAMRFRDDELDRGAQKPLGIDPGVVVEVGVFGGQQRVDQRLGDLVVADGHAAFLAVFTDQLVVFRIRIGKRFLDGGKGARPVLQQMHHPEIARRGDALGLFLRIGHGNGDADGGFRRRKVTGGTERFAI